MNWKMKVTMLERSGLSREDAMAQVLNQLQAANKDMDEKLSKAISMLSKQQVIDIMGEM